MENSEENMNVDIRAENVNIIVILITEPLAYQSQIHQATGSRFSRLEFIYSRRLV